MSIAGSEGDGLLGFAVVVVVAVVREVVLRTVPGVSAPPPPPVVQPRGVSPAVPNRPDAGVMLTPRRPRRRRPSRPRVIASVSFWPAEAIHSASLESRALRYSS